MQVRAPPLSAALVASVTCAMALGCSRDDAPRPPPRPAAPMAATALATAFHVDAAAALEPTLDPPAPAGDLRGEIDAFTTVDACVAQRASLDPLVGDALQAVGYASFLRDACRTLDAAKARDVKRCDAIDAPPLRAHCLMLVAVLAGDPDDCAFYVSERPAMGRDPTCLAVASHDARLCAAEGGFLRPTCEALASRDAKACNGYLSDGERAVCRRELDRFATILPDISAGTAGKTNIERPTGSLVIRADDDTTDAAAPAIDMAPELARGIVLDEEHDGTHLELGVLRELASTPYGNPPLAPPHVGLALVLGAAPSSEVTVDHCELGMPNEPTLVSPGARCTVEVHVDALAHVRGGPARLTVHGDVGTGAGARSFTMTIATFVRDVVRGPFTAGPR